MELKSKGFLIASLLNMFVLLHECHATLVVIWSLSLLFMPPSSGSCDKMEFFSKTSLFMPYSIGSLISRKHLMITLCNISVLQWGLNYIRLSGTFGWLPTYSILITGIRSVLNIEESPTGK